jgi:hypothetical protein
MKFGGKPTVNDLLYLIKNSVHEDRELDYKETLPDQSPDSHRNFLYDASSLANAAGGLLIFGVRERRDSGGKPTGEPEEAVGLANFNQDAEILRLDSMLRDGIEPRIPEIRPHVVRGLKNGSALVLAVPKSRAGPHMAKHGGTARFYTRNNRGNEPMNYHQIREAFAASSTVIEKARHFRDERIQKIAVGAGLPTELGGRARSVLHLIPLSAIGVPDAVDILLPKREINLLPAPGWLSNSSSGQTLNFDGFARTVRESCYAQLFRFGAIEAVDSHLLNFASTIPWPTLETEVLEQTIRYLKCLDTLGCDPPIGVALTLINVQGFPIAADGPPSFASSQGLDREILQIPEVVAESFDGDVPTLVRPIFDTLWQSCGRERSHSYDAEGKCILKLRA